jgi:hypothetical protein
MTVATPRLARVVEGHMADLAKSGLTPETVLAAGIYSASAAEASALVGYSIGPALVFPYERDGEGQPTYARVKLDQSDDPKRRYRAPSGRGNRLYIPFTSDPYALTDPKTALYITEGEKKTLCAVQHGLNCIGVSGVYNWKAKNGDGESTPIADLHALPWQDREVRIVFDSDAASNPDVLRAERELAAELTKRGARVSIIRLPAGPNGAKQGLDDFLVAKGIEAFHVLPRGPATRPAAPFTDGLGLVSVGDLLAEPAEAHAWVVEGRLPAGGLAGIFGKPKAGKSTAARGLALCVARSVPWLGFQTTGGPVIYLALEEKRQEVREHFRAMGATDEDPILILCSAAPLDAIERLRLEAARRRPALIIIDPLFRFIRVEDGDDYATMTAALEPLLTLARESGACVLLVHHLGKGERPDGGDAILGSTAILASVDSALMMKRTDRYRTLSSIQRYGQDLDEITINLDPITRTVTAGPSRADAELAEAGQLILQYLASMDHPVTEAEIDGAIECRRQAWKRALRELAGSGNVERTGRGGKADPFRYSGSPSIYGNQGTRTCSLPLSTDHTKADSGSQVPHGVVVPRFPA